MDTLLSSPPRYVGHVSEKWRRETETNSLTQPNTIGLSLFDNPVGQLAWIGEKMILCE